MSADDRLVLVFENGDTSLSVRRFVVRETIARPFDVRIVARSPDDALDFDSFVGKKAGFGIVGGVLSSARAWSGVVSHMMQLEVEPNGLSTYFVRIVPSLALLSYRQTRRIFEHSTVPDIVKEVLGRHGIVPKLELREGHGEHELRVQLDETDLAFVSRLLEEEGISYVFEQVREGEGWTSRVVLRDRPELHEPRAGGPLRYVDNPNEAARREYVTRVRLSNRVRPAHVTLRDYDFTQPDRVIVGRSEPVRRRREREQPALEMDWETYRYAPSAFIKERRGAPRRVPEAEATAVATIARDARRHDQRQVFFESNAFDIAPGVVTAFDGHPHPALGPERKLLVTETTVEGTHDGEWTLEGVASFADVPYRPEQATVRPVVRGVESATVVGPEGEEIWTDEHGRVRVHFHWDRDHLPDERASCWVRVSQPWAGGAFGTIVLPRVGQEVVVDFFEGDPDQPVVVGRTFNGKNRAPYELPAERTRTAYKSSSSPGGKGFNEIAFDDEAGRELVWVQAEKDSSKLVRADETERVGRTRLEIVGQNRTAVVGKHDTILVGEEWRVAIAPPVDLAILRLGDPQVDVGDTQVRANEGSISLATGEATGWLDGADLSFVADGDVTLHAGGQVYIDGGPNVKINCKDVSGHAAKAAIEVADRAARPEGRLLGAIKALFGKKEAPAPAEKPPERKELVVPHRIQKGPTCGLAALGMILDYWHAKDPKNPAPDADSLLATAQKNGYTQTGGMIEADEANLARDLGYDATFYPLASLADVKKTIDSGTPALVSFSVDEVGDPKDGTDRGHFAVIRGYFQKDGKEYLVAQHGWSTAATRVWDAKAFERSWKAVNHGKSPLVVVRPK